MIFNVSGGGGTALNFRVVKNPQPINPSENCIWVNTDTPITSWIFSAEKPNPAEAGMVWFPVGTSSPVAFSALKKQNIMVYPQSAKQYVGSAWVDVTAKSYQGGAWVDWITWLYKDGNQYTDITGGWIKVVENQSHMDIVFDDDVSVTWKGGDYIGSYFYTEDAIDVTSKSWLSAEALITARYDASRHIEIAMCKNLPSNFAYSADSSAKFTELNTEGTVEVDLRNLSGKYYIVVNCAGVSGTVADIGLK